jgi:uncharacterized membrane protein
MLMKKSLLFAAKAMLSGFLVVVPIYLAVLLLLKAMKTVGTLVQPFTLLMPEWFPAERALSLLLVLVICFLIGVAIRTPTGCDVREWIEKSFFERIPGYALLRSLTHQLTADTHEKVWKPALAEIEDALVPAFIIEEFEDGTTQCSYRQFPRRLLAPSTSPSESGSIRWRCPSRRLSRWCPSGIGC